MNEHDLPMGFMAVTPEDAGPECVTFHAILHNPEVYSIMEEATKILVAETDLSTDEVTEIIANNIGHEEGTLLVNFVIKQPEGSPVESAVDFFNDVVGKAVIWELDVVNNFRNEAMPTLSQEGKHAFLSLAVHCGMHRVFEQMLVAAAIAKLKKVAVPAVLPNETPETGLNFLMDPEDND